MVVSWAQIMPRAPPSGGYGRARGEKLPLNGSKYKVIEPESEDSKYS